VVKIEIKRRKKRREREFFNHLVLVALAITIWYKTLFFSYFNPRMLRERRENHQKI
jgi:hypothetical protein